MFTTVFRADLNQSRQEKAVLKGSGPSDLPKTSGINPGNLSIVTCQQLK